MHRDADEVKGTEGLTLAQQEERLDIMNFTDTTTDNTMLARPTPKSGIFALAFFACLSGPCHARGLHALTASEADMIGGTPCRTEAGSEVGKKVITKFVRAGNLAGVKLDGRLIKFSLTGEKQMGDSAQFLEFAADDKSISMTAKIENEGAFSTQEKEIDVAVQVKIFKAKKIVVSERLVGSSWCGQE